VAALSSAALGFLAAVAALVALGGVISFTKFILQFCGKNPAAGDAKEHLMQQGL
jgi:hypothetical protein